MAGCYAYTRRNPIQITLPKLQYACAALFLVPTGQTSGLHASGVMQKGLWLTPNECPHKHTLHHLQPSSFHNSQSLCSGFCDCKQMQQPACWNNPSASYETAHTLSYTGSGISTQGMVGTANLLLCHILPQMCTPCRVQRPPCKAPAGVPAQLNRSSQMPMHASHGCNTSLQPNAYTQHHTQAC